VYQYDAMVLLDKELRFTQGDSTPETLAAALAGMTYEGVRGPVTIDPTTHGVTQAWYRVDIVLDGDRVTTRLGPRLGVFSPTMQIE
jgi:hypothetical protein